MLKLLESKYVRKQLLMPRSMNQNIKYILAELKILSRIFVNNIEAKELLPFWIHQGLDSVKKLCKL